MLCSADRSSDRVSGTVFVIGACLIALIACLAGCGSESATTTDSAEAQVAVTDGGGLSSLFGSSSAELEEATGSATLKTGDVVTTSIGMKLGVVPPGEFSMGSPATEEKRSGDESRHRVRLTKPIFMSIHEITQAEFQRVMETNPSGITDSDRLPVQNVSWEQAVAFCRKLSELPEEKAAGRVYRLPSEAEWEYACRAGSETPASFGSEITSAQANFDGNYPYAATTPGTFVGKPQAVGSYEPNAWGFYDMHGNLWEWCQDWYAADYYASSAADDPQGPETGISHVIRGGSWYNFGYVLRSAYRSEFTPPLESNIYGFRVVASFGPDNTFQPSALDTAVPTPMSPPSTTPAPAVVAAASSTATTSASSSVAARMTDADPTMETPSAVPDSTVTQLETRSGVIQSRPTAAPTSIVTASHFVLFPVALLALLSLVDSGRLNQHRHYDLLPLLLIPIVSILPHQTLQITIFQLLAIAVAGRLIYGIRSGVMPKAVIPRLAERSLLCLAVSAFLAVTALDLMFAAHTPLAENILSSVARGAVAVALVLIGQRWKSRILGLSLAVVWLVIPGSHTPLAAALILWAFVFVNRAPLAGVLFGCAIASNWWLCCLVPLWFSYYRGKARMRFLTTSVTCGLVGLLALTVLPGLLAIQDVGNLATSAGAESLILRGLSVAVLAGAAAASCVWPKAKSEATVTALCTLMLLCVFVCSRSGSAMGLVTPWLILVLVGGCASHGNPVVTDGLVMPNIRRLMTVERKAGSQ